jgi:hypothetical protein
MRYVATQAGPWRVNHDASGKVVVRRIDKDNSEVVIAVAQWGDAGTTGRLQTKASVPSDDGWAQIDQAIRVALDAAANMPPDTRLDPGVLPPPVKKLKADGTETDAPEPKLTVVGTIGAIIVVALLGVGIYFAWPVLKVFLDHDRGKANGETCKMDMDCRSDVCDYGRCAAGKRKRGDRCDMDSQCTSDDCSRGLCN